MVIQTILIIKQNQKSLCDLKLFLKTQGYAILEVHSGKKSLKQSYENHPDLILLEDVLPGSLSSLQTCQRLREYTDTPIIVLGSPNQTAEMADFFQAGASDYIRPPLEEEELLARIQRCMTHTFSSSSFQSQKEITGYQDHYLEINLPQKYITVNGERVSLTKTEFKLLSCLIKQQANIVPHHQLMREVWGEVHENNRLLALYIHYLRDKIQDHSPDHQYIRTEWGEGYMFLPYSPAT
jgi:DNA-binding response OmpR family regulator